MCIRDRLKLELFLYGESLGVYTIERRRLVTVWAALVTAIRDGPHLVVFVHEDGDKRQGLIHNNYWINVVRSCGQQVVFSFNENRTV